MGLEAAGPGLAAWALVRVTGFVDGALALGRLAGFVDGALALGRPAALVGDRRTFAFGGTETFLEGRLVFAGAFARAFVRAVVDPRGFAFVERALAGSGRALGLVAMEILLPFVQPGLGSRGSGLGPARCSREP